MTEGTTAAIADRPASTRLSAPEIARQQGMNPVDYLRQRGFIQDSSDEEGLRKAFDEGTVTYYIGFDPTGPSLHAGHMVSIMLLASLQRMGHRPIALGGGGTAMVGDPTGKTVSREVIKLEDLEANLGSISAQLAKYLDFSGDQFDGGNPAALLVNNADWLLTLQYIPFLRDIGRHFSVNEMLSLETYKTRIDSGNGLNFVEFNYRLVQAYDFLHLFREMGCTLQMGGSDQWANITGGVDLIRRADQGKAFALVSPLVTTASGEKMGKTGTGVRVWLDPKQFSPYDYYQYWVNTDDAMVETYLNRFTFLPNEEIADLTSVSGEALREAKRTLAFEATALAHGVEEAEDAERKTLVLFARPRRYSSVPQVLTTEQKSIQEYLEHGQFATDATTFLGNASPEVLSSVIKIPDDYAKTSDSGNKLESTGRAAPTRVSQRPFTSPFESLLAPVFEHQRNLSQTILSMAGFDALGASITRTTLGILAESMNMPNPAQLIRWDKLIALPEFTSSMRFPVEKVETTAVLLSQLDSNPADDASLPTTEISASEVADLTLGDAFVKAELAKGRGEARRLATQGGLSVDDVKVDDVDVPLADALAGRDAVILRAGKKRFKRVAITE